MIFEYIPALMSNVMLANKLMAYLPAPLDSFRTK